MKTQWFAGNPPYSILSLALVAAFAAPTELLVLEEPTSGLDPLMERVFGRSVAEAAAAFAVRWPACLRVRGASRCWASAR